jgi:leader peptidase (prepilin peptidase)/N-methyltransferase
MVGSFLNVCIYRLPKEKSPLWPLGSRCGSCFQPIRWYDNLPLLSYWRLRGRCRTCGAAFSVRYFCIELLTALGFVGLFYVEVVYNVHQLNERALGGLTFQIALVTIFAYHAILLCFLLVATFCDFDGRTIPLSLTITGSVVGVIGGVLWAWPWPYSPMQGVQKMLFPGMFLPVVGLQPWPAWMPLPAWLAPGGNWQTGLVNSLAGMLVGTLMVRAIRFLFGLGMGADYMEEPDPDHLPRTSLGRAWSWFNRVGGKTLGLGDADLMMMAGAFLGWQPIIAAFFIGVFPGMILGMVQMSYRGENTLPFGPALAVGIIVSMLFWGPIGENFAPIFYTELFLIAIVTISAVSMLIAGYVLRMMRLLRGEPKDEGPTTTAAKS